MAQVEWVMACDLAYFDRQDRLCMVGVTKHLLLPSLPVRLRGLVLVAHLTNVHPGERFSVGVVVSTPDGDWVGPSNPNAIHIEVVDDYILATLRDLPLADEGTYRFALRLNPEQHVPTISHRLVYAILGGLRLFPDICNLFDRARLEFVLFYPVRAGVGLLSCGARVLIRREMRKIGFRAAPLLPPGQVGASSAHTL